MTHRKETKTYEIRVYLMTSMYSGDLELLTTTHQDFKDVSTEHGKIVSSAQTCMEEYARNIGLFGITVEHTEGVFSFYPPQRIGKVEYNEVD